MSNMLACVSCLLYLKHRSFSGENSVDKSVQAPKVSGLGLHGLRDLAIAFHVYQARSPSMLMPQQYGLAKAASL